MCGIAGLINLTGAPLDDSHLRIVRTMTDAIKHRGPDDGDVYADNCVVLGHRRLSIIDLASGHQPMFNEDFSVCVVFNGEIYNFEEVRDELIDLGHTFKTRSDTEIIVHGWEQWGELAVNKFRGMFAFVLWDKAQRSVWIARDRLGVKPIYYGITPSGILAFGSELKAIVASELFSKTISLPALDQYLAFGYVPEPLSIYNGIFKLPAAHSAVIRWPNIELNSSKYWSIDYGIKAPPHSDFNEAIESLVTESVRLRMIADVPLGAFLSGGVDSSLVVSTMSKLSTQSQVQTCSIGFTEEKYDETRFAKAVARHCNTNHVVQMVGMHDLNELSSILKIYDEPFADSSAIATYRVCQLARQRVTVALSGDGGDEAFGGYRRYRFHANEERFKSNIPSKLRSPIFGALGKYYPNYRWMPQITRGQSTFRALSKGLIDAYTDSMTILKADERALLLRGAFQLRSSEAGAQTLFASYAQTFSGHEPLDLMQHIDFHSWLPGDINTKVDRASMAHSLEAREPLLDHKLIEFAASIPQ